MVLVKIFLTAMLTMYGVAMLILIKTWRNDRKKTN